MAERRLGGGGRKIAGFLTEGKAGEYAVLGIGLNVNNPIPKELEGGSATAMVNFIGRPLPLERVRERLLFHLDGWYRVFKGGRPELMMAKVRERTFILGRTVRVIEDSDELVGGRALDVLDDGSLLLDVNGELRRVLYGDVSLRFF